MRIGRKNVRKTFDTKTAAEMWERQQLDQLGRTGTDSTLGVSEVAEYREARALSRGTDLRVVATFWAERNPEAEKVTVARAISEYEASREWARLAATTKANEHSKLSQFASVFGGFAIGNLTIENLEKYFDDIPSIVTRNGHVRLIRTFFKWCMDRRHRFITHSPAEALKMEPEAHGTPRYLRLDQVRRIFDEAVKSDTGLIPFLALGFFAGIRSYEILRLEPSDFQMDEKRIVIRAEVAKRKRLDKPLPRLIEGLPDTLWLWLSAVRFDGSLDQTNYIKRRQALYTRAGVSWSNSVARHTFATFAYALFQDAGRVRKLTGHRSNDTVLLTHYAALETQANGGKYFQIVPTGAIPETREIGDRCKKVGWPPDDELLKLAHVHTKMEIAKRFGVTEAAVRKKLRKIAERARVT